MSEPPVPCRVESTSFALMQCPVAGFQHHGGEACWSRIHAGDPLRLRREPGNRHDARAITVEWQGVMLGYVPREANYALSQMMDRGVAVEARVQSLRAGGDPWQRVMIEVAARPASLGAPEDQPPAPVRTELVPPRALPAPRLALARMIGALTPAQREVGLKVLHECVPEIARRLALGAAAFHDEHRRWVHLWDSVRLEIGADGRGLGVRYLAAPSSPGPSLTLDLKRPLGEEGWIACFVPVIAAVCDRHGLTKASMVEPLRRWVGASLLSTFEEAIDFEAVRKAVLEFLAPDPLARSLANRTFGAAPSAEAFGWVCAHRSAIALCAVEHPAMLPFLRIVADDKRAKDAPDPLAALHDRLVQEGLEPAAWKKLPRWGFGAFERLGEAWVKPIPVARFANLLHRLDVQAPPPGDFARHALTIAQHRIEPGARLDFERHPLWFTRAFLRELERAPEAGRAAAVRELPGCLDWLIEARPSPDANQQHAGWPWILEQAREHRKARELALAAPWPVPAAEMAWGVYRVVPIRCVADLVAEAVAMKNCLGNYEEACRSGAVAVFSIRERSTGVRIACFAADREGEGPWELVEVSGKMNSAAGAEMERIAEAMVVKLNGGRGGDKPPF